MKFFLLSLLVIIAACSTTKETSEVPLPPVTVITPGTPSVPESNSATLDKDCNQMVPANFANTVIKHIENKPNITKQNSQKAYWIAFFKSLAKAESCLNPVSRYVEPPSLGKDAVTGKQNTSEGYFQMSYQDSKFHGCKFDYAADKVKATSDKTKTIFDMENQIECAAIVLDKQLKSGVLMRPYYWSVLGTKNASGLAKFKKFMKAEGY